jgi:hypothetical protein
MRNALLTPIKFVAALAMLLVAGLPLAASAHRETILGSLTVSNGTDLKDQVVGFVLISNPGLAKNVVQHLPPLTVPILIDIETEDSPGPSVLPSRPRILQRHMDTTVVLTNLTADELQIDITLRNADGGDLGTRSITLPGHGTRAVVLSEVLAEP